MVTPAFLTELSLASSPWLLTATIIILSTLCMLLLKGFLLHRLTRVVDRSRFRIDSLIAHASNLPLTLVILVINLFLLSQLLAQQQLGEADSLELLRQTAKILLIVAILIFIDRLSSGAIKGYAASSDVLRNSNGIATGISRGLIIAIGLLVILGTLGISVTPVIASLGISSLAVALALQPTLENFFSGVQLVMDKPFRVGDFIELESGEQGFVEKIGWRSTWIKMLPNNVVIMPNSNLSQSRIINYFYPSKELSVPVEIGVHYKSDLDHVERVTLEVARQILQEHEFGVETYDTFILFHSFADSSINFTVMLRAHEYFQRFFLKSAFIKALYKRYNQEGIVIPYPIRAINLEQEQVQLPGAPGPTDR